MDEFKMFRCLQKCLEKMIHFKNWVVIISDKIIPLCLKTLHNKNQLTSIKIEGMTVIFGIFHISIYF